MLCTFLLLFLVISNIYQQVYSQENAFFRPDYTYNKDFMSFYKVHKKERPWREAKTRCSHEGAYLFYPENKKEALYVAHLITQSFPRNPKAWIGISDILAEGDFETFNGRPIDEIYTNWSDFEPNNGDDNEDCVELSGAATMNDLPCSKLKPFICKKTLESMDWNYLCDLPDPSYQYNNELGKCYKFHTKPLNWTSAYDVCLAEQSYLAVINSQKESDFFVQLTEANKDKYKGSNYVAGAVLLGFHNMNLDGYTTVYGTPLEDSGFMVWGGGQPDGVNSEFCGSMFYNGQLNDMHCAYKCFFICEHDILANAYNINERM